MQVQALFSSCADLLTNMFPDLPAKFSHNVGSARKMQRLAASMLIPADEVCIYSKMCTKQSNSLLAPAALVRKRGGDSRYLEVSYHNVGSGRKLQQLAVSTLIPADEVHSGHHARALHA